MHSAKVLHRNRILITIALLAIAAPDVYAKPHIHTILAKGSQWTLNVNGDQAKLTLLGGKGGQISGGGFEVFYNVDWGGQKGTLSGVSDAKNSRQAVTLELTRRNGIKVTCNGFIAQETDEFMAGVCGTVARGAFYATRVASGVAAQSDVTEQKYRACVDNLRNSQNQYKKALQQRDNTQNRLVSTSNQLNSCKNQAANASTGPDVRPYSSFRNAIDGRYAAGGKTDQVTALAFPGSPGQATELGKWLRAHNNALLSVVNGILPQADRPGFRSLEQQRCGNNDYCQAGIRQQAIACGLGIGC